MTTLLVGDIGGTKTVLRLVQLAETGDGVSAPGQTALHEQVYPSQAFADLVPIVQTFLSEVADSLEPVPAIAAACFGIAGPVVDNASELTNLNWQLDGTRLERELEIAPVLLINDFAANSFGVLGVAEDEMVTLQEAEVKANAPIAVIGAGTGLGQSFLIPAGDGYQVFATEGGHADFSPRSQQDFQLLQYLRDRDGLGRVSVERIVSGGGIVRIYRFLRDGGSESASQEELPELAAKVKQWEVAVAQGKLDQADDPAPAIAEAALNQTNPLCEEALRLFVSSYGAEAGNVALKLLPYGGLYIAGGIAAKILPLMQRGEFLQAFHHKGRMEPILHQIPIRIILNPRISLIGGALYAAQTLKAG